MSTNLPSVGVIGRTAATYARDLAERVIRTFLQASLAAVTVTTPFDLGMWKAAGLGGIAAGYSLITGPAAKIRGDNNSASLVKGT